MEYKLGVIEMRFADIIWENEPLQSGELVRLCEKELGWKRKVDFKGLGSYDDGCGLEGNRRNELRGVQGAGGSLTGCPQWSGVCRKKSSDRVCRRSSHRMSINLYEIRRGCEW